MKKKYTHIFFDLDNTLWDFETNSRNAMYITFQRLALGEVCDFNKFFEAYSQHNDLLWEGYRNNKVSKKELVKMRFVNTLSELEISEFDSVNMNNIYLEEMSNQTVLNDGALDILTYLKAKHYHLNIITNGFKEVQYKKIETSGLKPFFDKIFISEEVKSPKPSYEIFEYSIKSSNAKKINSIMIGDDWDVDIKGALNFGIDAIYYTAKTNKNLTNVSYSSCSSCRVFRIMNLNQLTSVF